MIDTERAFPARIGMRWAIRRRLEGVSAKSVYQYNNTIAWIYDWAAFAADGVGDLDLYFTEGRCLSRGQVRSLLSWIDTKGRPHRAGRINGGFRLSDSEPEVLLPKLRVVRVFLTFALDPALRKGKPLSEKRREEALRDLETTLEGFSPALIEKNRKTPGGRFTDDEIEAIRGKISCRDGTIPTEVFPLKTAYRNWLLFEVNCVTGFRVSELAALTLSSLSPRSDLLALRDERDAGWDAHRREAAGSKTFGRDMPVPEWLLKHLHHYVTGSDQVWGRKGRRGVPALWTGADGRPLSVRQISKIFQQIGQVVGFRVTVHRGRHRMINKILDHMDESTATWLTGHSSPRGLEPYIRERLAEQAQRFHREAHQRTQDELLRIPREMLNDQE